MRLANNIRLLPVLGGALLIAAIPAIGQDAPESILPPGFGDPVEAPPAGDEPAPRRPADILPTGPSAPTAIGSTPADPLDPNGDALSEEDELALEPPVMPDLPASAKRSTAQVGLLEESDGGLGEAAFGTADGRYLSHLMRQTRAPLASRWSSILLRRALLTKAGTPRNVDGADWVAERAWLLIRMGEADAARLLVQSVDVDRYTPKMFDIAMQAALASADPAALCPMVEPAQQVSKVRAWRYAKAMCSGLSGESGQASALIDGVRGGAPIDKVLAEKVVGAGVNTRRAVTVEWEKVDALTAWRFGLANATAAEIPDRLLSSASPHVLAWYARAPLVSVDKRVKAAETAAMLGVFSSAALVDFYGQLSDFTEAAGSADATAATLSDAYSGDAAARVAALRSLWKVSDETAPLYVRQLLTARASARVAPDEDYAGDVDGLVSAMMSTGLDVQAARWARFAENGSLAWALLAVGAPGQVVNWDAGAIDNVDGGDGRRAQFLFAGLAGMGRIPASSVDSLASDLEVPIGRNDAWTRALDRAVAAREPGTVALLCALGLQGGSWNAVSATRVYHAISALRRVGLTGEARMIAAEAVTRT